VHLHRTDPTLLTGLLSLDDADHLLTSTAIRTPSVRLARDGSVLAESTYTRGATLAGKQLTGLVDPRKALTAFGDGATVVFQGMHRYWPPLTRLVAELELELGHPCQANAYLTPPGSQGFAVHSDSHDVFVFQTEGAKRWEVHTPDGVEDVLLEPGLSMYLPTGTPHAARAQDTVSLHVTLGITQLTWRGLVERSVRVVLADVPDEHLPAGYLDSPEDLAGELGDRLEALAAEVRRVDPTAAVQAEVRRFLTSRSPRLPGGLKDVLAAGDLDDTTLLRRRPGHPCVLLDRGDRIDVLLGDRSIDVPAWLRPALDEIRARPELRPADLADVLDPQSRLVLCSRLTREGLLEVVA
jgi:mannose-6-phosphate isomerase-like protein (cupin superfamily)